MPEDAPPNGDAPPARVADPDGRVSEMQAKLHRWAAADPGRRFDDLFNFVHDPATLLVAFARVAGNRGATTPGVDGWTVAAVEEDDTFALLAASDLGEAAPLLDRGQELEVLAEAQIRELCAVGDDYQSIFGFTGASPEHLLGFAGRFEHATVIRLEENHAAMMVLHLTRPIDLLGPDFPVLNRQPQQRPAAGEQGRTALGAGPSRRR